MNSTFIILLILLIIGIVFYKKNFKQVNLGTINLVTGAPKTGKSTLSVALVLKTYDKLLMKYKVQCFFCKIFKKQVPEKPLLYSNIPIVHKEGYVPLTKDILERKKRLAINSVIYIGEFSLVADSFSYLDKELNEKTELFFKLIGHESHVTCIVDTQSVKDCHYNLKRVLSSFVYIHHLKVIPFFIIAYVREFAYLDTDNNSVVNNLSDDLDCTLKKILLPKSIWKKFDYRCYSILTDNLPLACDVSYDYSTLKQSSIVSYKNYKFLTFGGSDENKNKKF